MIRYHLLKDRRIEDTNINSIVYNNDDKLYFASDNGIDYLQYSISADRRHFEIKKVGYGYEYDIKQSGYPTKKEYLGHKDYDGLIDYKYSPSKHWSLTGNEGFYQCIPGAGAKLTMPDGEWTTDIQKESRLFQFLLKWAYQINFDDIRKIDSFEFTKGFQDDLARRGLKLKHNFRLLSWNGQLESDETGVITNEELTEVWVHLLNQMK